MNAQVDFEALKTRQRAAWASGDYAVIGTTLQLVGEELAEACDLRFGERVLDVAAGNGNATLAAARRGCRVVSSDYVESLLERGAERAHAERLEVVFNFRYRSAAHFIEVFRSWYGPVHKAFAALPPPGAAAFERDLTELLESRNRGGAASLLVPSDYVEAVLVRR